jgi:hypothetical protein
VKRYLYISETKVDMVYLQIESPILKLISDELKINSVDNVYSKVAVVDKYLRSYHDVGNIENVGSVESPKPYIKDTLPLGRDLIADDDPVYEDGSTPTFRKFAIFAGRFGDTRLVMVGAADSMVGSPTIAESDHSVDYYTSNFFNWAGYEALKYRP